MGGKAAQFQVLLIIR